MKRNTPERVRQLLDERSTIEPTTGCRLWLKGSHHGGYGVISIGESRSVDVHRVAYELHYGPIPDGLFVRRRCNNHSCIEPAHLYLGTLASDKTLAERLEQYSIPEPNTGCLLWTGSTLPSGYGQLRWNRKCERASRLSYMLAYGPIPDGVFVCHKCDTPACIEPTHLFLGTQKDNAQDMAKKGRQGLHVNPERAVRGERHHSAKITDATVVDIRRAHSAGVTGMALSRQYGLSNATISNIVRRRTWRHVV